MVGSATNGARRRRVVLCGGGTGSHVLAAELGGDPAWEVRVLTHRPEEWSEAVVCEERGGLVDAFPVLLGRQPRRHEGRAEAFHWRDAAAALDGADAALLVCPVHAHRDLLEKILPAIDRGRPMLIGTLFAQGGFDWVIRDVLDRHRLALPRATFFGLKRYPYLCRKLRYGREVALDGRFPVIGAAIDAPSPAALAEADAILSAIFHKPVRQLPFASCTLTMSNQILHMGLVVGHLHDYAPDKVYPTRPRLYSEAPWAGAMAMEALFRDVLRLAIELEPITGLPLRRHLGLDPLVGVPLRARLALGVDLEASPRLERALVRAGLTLLRSNKRLRHVQMPMKPGPDGHGFVADRASRFWEDDVTHGLCVLHGLAAILGVELRAVPGVIATYQELTGRRLVDADGGLGPDFATSGAPQRYGVTDRAGLRRLLHRGLRG